MANILVCDDDKDIVEAIHIYLQQEGHQGSEQAEKQPFNHKRPADKAVRSAAHLHNGDLLAAGKRGEANGI